MITISKSKLKARMLEVLRAIEETGEEVVVTHRGRPVLRIQPISPQRSVEPVFGELRERGVVSRERPDAPTTGEWPEP